MSNNTNKTNVPEAKEAMDRFKMEVANELGVPLSNGYNGNLTSAQNGSVGGHPQNSDKQTDLLSGHPLLPPQTLRYNYNHPCPALLLQ